MIRRSLRRAVKPYRVVRGNDGELDMDSGSGVSGEQVPAGDWEMLGGAHFVDDWGYLVPRPLAVLVIHKSGIRVDVRPSWHKKLLLFSLPARSYREPDLWAAEWGAIAGVRIAGASAVLESKGGKRCLFFAALPDEFTSLLAKLSENGTPVELMPPTTAMRQLLRRRPR